MVGFETTKKNQYEKSEVKVACSFGLPSNHSFVDLESVLYEMKRKSLRALEEKGGNCSKKKSNGEETKNFT